jgi:dolichol-phosphate mannosyltransferase
VLDTILIYGLKGKFFQTEIAWSGYPTSFIPYVRQRRPFGKSQHTFGKKLKIFIDAVLDASYLPIRVISIAGVLLSILGFFYAGVVVYAWYVSKTPFTGYAPIIISVLVVGGLNILLLGIVGEYIWRIYDHVRGKPNYVVKDIFQ